MSFIENIRKWLYNEQFKPSPVGLFINPFYFVRKALFTNIKKYAGNISGNILDIGCGSKPYESLFNVTGYTGIDIQSSGHNHETSKVDVFYDGKTIPFNNETFDSLICFEVLEHVFNPDDFLKEANRVLKKDGVALFSVPFIWDEHEKPYDFARYSSFGLNSLLTKAGFEILSSKKILADLRIIAVLTNLFIFKVIRALIPGKLSYIFILPFTALINILAHVSYLLPGNNDLYYGNIILLRKIQAR